MKTDSLPSVSDDICSRSYLKNSFVYFFYLAFSLAIKRIDGNYIIPEHLKPICGRLQFCKRTSTIAPRFHLKSTLVEAYIVWKLYRMEHNWNEWQYMSYTEESAAYHTKRIKRYIEALPELLGGYTDLTQSESILYYSSPEGRRFFHCEPTGILTFQRGKHPNGIICDDVLRDPQVRMDLSQLEKITRTFFEEIEQMPKEEIHLVGTPQDQEDLLSQLETKSGYNCKRYDAIVDAEKHITLWPGLFSWDELEARRQRIGEKAFMKEFRCQPVRGAEGFLSPDEYNRIVNKELINYAITSRPELMARRVYAGFDIGKKTHPSHLSVFDIVKKHEKDKAIQIHSKFMDGWNYADQLNYLRQAIEVFDIDKLHYDDTRAEFEECRERGELPRSMKGVAFTAKTKFSMATELDRVVTNGELELIADDRQKRQILSVDCDLEAPETSEGHGDAFFSLCLAIDAWKNRSKSIFEVLSDK